MMIPEPQDEPSHSGKLVLRLPKTLHVRAVKAADQEGVSLNTYLVQLIAEGVRSSEIASPRSSGEERQLQRQFWEELLKRARTKTSLHAEESPPDTKFLRTSASMAGLYFTYWFNALVHGRKVAGSGFEADPKVDGNREIFRRLKAAQQAIDTEFGEPPKSLRWSTLNPKPYFPYVWKYIEIDDYRDRGRWTEIQDAMIDAMIRLERIITPRIGSGSV